VSERQKIEESFEGRFIFSLSLSLSLKRKVNPDNLSLSHHSLFFPLHFSSVFLGLEGDT
jgi:hypothetical protein